MHAFLRLTWRNRMQVGNEKWVVEGASHSHAIMSQHERREDAHIIGGWGRQFSLLAYFYEGGDYESTLHTDARLPGVGGVSEGGGGALLRPQGLPLP